jgi:hypothetical protein
VAIFPTNISSAYFTRFILASLPLCLFGLSTPAYAKNLPLKAGTYECFTITLMTSATPPRQRDDPVVVARRGARVRGEIDVPDVEYQPLMLAPAAFGHVILDGKGGYKMPTIGQGGRYGFNAATGRPTFTGDLGAMLKNEYSGTGTGFHIGLGGMNFECGLLGAGNAAATAKPIARVDGIGPALKTAKASDLTGRFDGTYVCGQGLTNMILDLMANEKGALVARMTFGGNAGKPKGSYTLTGTWSGAKFTLKSKEWISQPPNYVMVDLEGEVSAKGVAGNVINSTCSNFAAERVQK